MSPDWKRFVLVLAAGVGAGIAWNTVNPHGIALGQSVFVQAGDELVPAREAKVLLDRGALFLDARPRDFWRMSRIPGALSLPSEDFAAAFPAVESAVRRARAVVVYCSGYGCEASHLVARRLHERGIGAGILDEGLPAWQDAKLPLDSEARP